ncbi:thioesterase [Streptomyces armeniacus]|uniref:Thioesterase n=1 Tax=Streptomyces armeniacus TaxID=83291 RepID=A0A345XQ09_9ACTN|nr:alpha/beta fold hydrolase [Streptomyces armeniacus]AXK33725.1 thioesterase [Streptomyces armeniacus]QIQ28647.1 Nbc51 [Streptomyces sp.]
MTAASADDGLWCRRFHPAPEASQRLICFPHAGGSASFYFPVSAALKPEVDVLAVQYPGRQDRRQEPGIDSVDVLADRVAEALSGWMDRPVTFFGHSMGAVVAFEVAHRLERDGKQPVRIFASGRRAPSRHRDEQVHKRDDDGLVAELRELAGTDAQVLGDEELLRMILPAIRSDYTAVETYESGAGKTVRAPISVLVGDDDPKTTLDEAADWKKHTSGGSDLQVFPGGHFFLSERAAEVMAVLRGHFAASRADGA